MKIGILTFHRAYNYGAVLQCYALKEVINHFGSDAQVIDYRQPDIERAYRYHSSFRWEQFKHYGVFKGLPYCIWCLYRDLKQIFIKYKKKSVFETFVKEHLNLSKPIINIIPQDYDVYVIGSDMLWSDECMHGNFDSIYLGKFPHKGKIVGYAISGTPASFKKLGNQTGYKFLNKFEAISIREKKLAEIVKQYTDKEVFQCIDPTLLTTKELWTSLINDKWKRKKYIVIYFLRKIDAGLKHRLIKFAKENHYEIVTIDVSPYANPITVEDFVSIISSSNYVVTDSFHGMIFSLIFERPFHAVKFNDPHDARYVDVLQRIGLEDNAVNLDYTPFIPQINYLQVKTKIDDFRSESLNYLKENICSKAH